MNIANEKDIKPDVALAEGGASPNEERYLAWGIWRRHVLVPGVIPVRAALARLLRAPSLGMGGRPPLWTEVRRRWLPADAGTRGQGERRLQISPSSSSLIVGQVVQTRRHTDLPPVKGTGEAVKTTVPNQSGTGRMVVQAQRNTEVFQARPTRTTFHVATPDQSVIIGQMVQTRRHTDLPPVKSTGEAVETAVHSQSGAGRMVVQAQRNTVLQAGPTGTIFHVATPGQSVIVGQMVQPRRHADLPPVKGTGEAVETAVPNQSGTGRMVVQAQRNTVLQTGPTGTVFHAATPGQSVIVGQVVQPRRHTDLPPARGSVAPFAPFTAQRAVATGQPVVASPATPESSPTAELPAIHAQEPMPETNVAQLAEQVYELLVRRLDCERERRGL
jgi:hypothetical protein